MVSANCGMCGDESLGLIVQNGKTYKKFINSQVGTLVVDSNPLYVCVTTNVVTV